MKKLLTSIILASPFLCSAQKQWTLQECISHALENNITIKRQQDNVEQSEISLNTSKYSRLPSLNASAGENFSFGRALMADNTYDNRNTMSTSFSLSTDVPLITGGRLYYDIQMKKLGLQAALADLDKARESVALNVVSAYLEAVYQNDLVEVAKNQLELSAMQVERMEKLVQNGKASESELAQIRSANAADALALTNQENNYKIAVLNLSQLLELNTPEGMSVVHPKDENIREVILTAPDIVYAEALSIKPQIKAEQIRLKSAEKNIGVARSGYFPSLNFNAGIGTNYYKTSGYPTDKFGEQLKNNFSQYLGLSLSVPIFNRFSTRNSVRSARVQLHEQQLALEETKKALYKEIQQAYYNALAAQKQCVSSDAALQSAQVSFELMQKKYENGKANATEFQESKTALLKAESTAIQARYQFLFREKILNFYRGVGL